MKMEGGEILKLSSTTKVANDGDGLTFGPAWLVFSQTYIYLTVSVKKNTKTEN